MSDFASLTTRRLKADHPVHTPRFGVCQASERTEIFYAMDVEPTPTLSKSARVIAGLVAILAILVSVVRAPSNKLQIMLWLASGIALGLLAVFGYRSGLPRTITRIALAVLFVLALCRWARVALQIIIEADTRTARSVIQASGGNWRVRRKSESKSNRADAGVRAEGLWRPRIHGPDASTAA